MQTEANIFTWQASFPPSARPAHIIPSVTFKSLYIIHSLQSCLLITGTSTSFIAGSYSDPGIRDFVCSFRVRNRCGLNFNSHLPSWSLLLPHPITVQFIPGTNSRPGGGKQTGSRCSLKLTGFFSWKKWLNF